MVPTSCALGQLEVAVMTRRLSRVDKLAIDLYVAAGASSQFVYDAFPDDVERWWCSTSRSKFRHINATTRSIWRRVARRAIELVREMDAGERGR